MKKIVIYFLLVVAILCVVGANAFAATQNVSIVDFAFSPQNIPINVGDTVVWTDNGFVPHTTTSGSGCTHNTTGVVWDSGTMSNGQTFQVTFNQAGTYDYFCSFHCGIGMTGMVIVNAVEAPAPSGPFFIDYLPVVNPVVDTNLALAKPLASGPKAAGGTLIDLQVALPQFQVPVDIYVIGFSSTLAPDTIFNVTAALAFQPVSLQQFLQAAAAGVPPAGMAPWMASVMAPVNSTLFANVPVSALAPGEYSFFVLVTLPNNLFNFDLFETDFTAP